MESKLIQNRRHHQILHFRDGYKRTINNVVKVWQQGWTHIVQENGVEWIINDDNVNCVEIQWLESPKQSKK